jgi:hypothetical protein
MFESSGYIDLAVKIVNNEARNKRQAFKSDWSGPARLLAQMRVADGDEYFQPLEAPPLESLRWAYNAPHYWSQHLALHYGNLLFEWLFAGELRRGLFEARSLASAPSRRLRIRLNIDESLPDLRGLRWECLCSKRDEDFLSCSGVFSRVHYGRAHQSWPTVERPIRLMTLVSNPPGPSELPRSEVGLLVSKLTQKVMRAHSELLVTDFRDRWSPQIIQDSAPPHIVALVARPAPQQEFSEPHFWVDGDHGQPQPVPWREVAASLVHPKSPPLLVLLATPTLGNPQEATAFVPFADALIDAGVQSVVAVQGPLELSHVSSFATAFFDALMNHGEVDAAVRSARESLRQQTFPTTWDWVFPVLTLRSPYAQLFNLLPEALESDIYFSLQRGK